MSVLENSRKYSSNFARVIVYSRRRSLHLRDEVEKRCDRCRDFPCFRSLCKHKSVSLATRWVYRKSGSVFKTINASRREKRCFHSNSARLPGDRWLIFPLTINLKTSGSRVNRTRFNPGTRCIVQIRFAAAELNLYKALAPAFFTSFSDRTTYRWKRERDGRLRNQTDGAGILWLAENSWRS